VLKVIEAQPCQDVESFAAELVLVAWTTGETVLGEFNSTTLVAERGSTRADVLRQWDEQVERPN
jgi:hypothetical protein